MLHTHNSYIKDLKSTIDTVSKGTDFQVAIYADQKSDDAHPGRFNMPTTKEVAVVIVGQAFERRYIIIQSRNSELSRISETHRSYDPLQYPLMFCYGEDGYSINTQQIDPQNKTPLKKTVSATEFYAYRIMEREKQENHIFYFRNLFNQFFVDMYANIQTERLSFIRNNQSKLGVENYIHLQDAMSRGDADLTNFGKAVFLPSSFTGGPRYMHERTQDAMTYVRHYGRPDLFITFT